SPVSPPARFRPRRPRPAPAALLPLDGPSPSPSRSPGLRRRRGRGGWRRRRRSPPRPGRRRSPPGRSAARCRWPAGAGSRTSLAPFLGGSEALRLHPLAPIRVPLGDLDPPLEDRPREDLHLAFHLPDRPQLCVGLEPLGAHRPQNLQRLL